LRHKFNAVALHGDLDQSARTAALDAFRKGEAKLLIASDVAARGLDIPDVSHVFNFDVPHHADDYVHRIGRTGRAGKSGTAITLVSSGQIDQKAVALIEKLTGQSIPYAGEPPAPASASDAPREERGRRDGGRGRGGRGRSGGDRKHHERPPSGPRHAERSEPAPVATQSQPEPKRDSHPRQAPAGDHDSPDTSHLPAFLLRPLPQKA